MKHNEEITDYFFNNGLYFHYLLHFCSVQRFQNSAEDQDLLVEK